MTGWRDIEGYEGRYQVSDDGRVKSVARDVYLSNGRFSRSLTERVLKPSHDQYARVLLSKDGSVRNCSIHRMVAVAFLGDSPFVGALVCHRDGNRHNNHVSNLYWGTVSDNNRDTVRHGRHKEARKTHCVNGHEFTPENTWMRARPDRPSLTRVCRTCNRTACRKYQEAS